MEAIVLAGGFGTRLRPITNTIPKSMIMFHEVPFLEYLLRKLIKNDVSHIILAVGYKHEMIESYFKESFQGVPITYSIESEPLGTGGAIAQASSHLKSKDCIVLNGDSFFDIDLKYLYSMHLSLESDATIALKHMINFNRYGKVLREGYKITNFLEKTAANEGDINGGIYVFKKEVLHSILSSKPFSIEKDFFEKMVSVLNFSGIPFNDTFIDIGILEDCIRAENILIG